jgi:hypothetical protein
MENDTLCAKVGTIFCSSGYHRCLPGNFACYESPAKDQLRDTWLNEIIDGKTSLGFSEWKHAAEGSTIEPPCDRIISLNLDLIVNKMKDAPSKENLVRILEEEYGIVSLIQKISGSTKKPVAICGICGRDDKEGTGEGGFCKYCGGDHWVELSDYESNGTSLTGVINHIIEAAKNIGMTPDTLFAKLTKLNQE